MKPTKITVWGWLEPNQLKGFSKGYRDQLTLYQEHLWRGMKLGKITFECPMKPSAKDKP